MKSQLVRQLAELQDQDRIPPINLHPLVSPAVSGLQVFDVETWWDSADPRGLFPSIRFGIRNVGKEPIGDLAVSAYFYTPTGMPFGKSQSDVIDRAAPVLAQGYWVRVDLNDQNFGSRRYESDEPEKLQAEIFASIGDCPELLLARVDFGERPRRLETHAGPNATPVSRVRGASKPFRIASESGPPPFQVSPGQLELDNIHASWAVDPSFSPNDLQPVVAFDVRNIGESPISTVSLLASFATPDGEVIGGCDFDFINAADDPLRPAASMPTVVPCHPDFSYRSRATPLIAEIYVKTDPWNALLLRSIDIPAR